MKPLRKLDLNLLIKVHGGETNCNNIMKKYHPHSAPTEAVSSYPNDAVVYHPARKQSKQETEARARAHTHTHINTQHTHTHNTHRHTTHTHTHTQTHAHAHAHAHTNTTHELWGVALDMAGLEESPKPITPSTLDSESPEDFYKLQRSR